MPKSTLHQHKEAFMLMTYASDDGTVTERIWNSRDGVTPFIVTSQDGTQAMTHVRWNEDVYAPDFVPPLGSRIFVDLTEKRAQAAAQRNADKYWDDPRLLNARSQFETKEEMVEMLAREYFQPGAPDLIVVAG